MEIKIVSEDRRGRDNPGTKFKIEPHISFSGWSQTVYFYIKRQVAKTWQNSETDGGKRS
jgi:hypothetical protein